jgi:hypothetical protein
MAAPAGERGGKDLFERPHAERLATRGWFDNPLRVFYLAERQQVDDDIGDPEPDPGVADPGERSGQSPVGIPRR